MIQVKNVTKDWHSKGFALTVLNDISFSVKEGEFVSIIGPSGCGKTTLLRLIAGLIKPTSGSTELSKTNLNKQSSIAKLSIVFQNPVLLKWRTVLKNVQLPLEINRKINAASVKEFIRLVGLEGFENKYPHELSGGMQQRTAIARSLVVNPNILLMDEPFGSLDEINRNKMNILLKDIKLKSNATVIFVTHSISEAVFLSDKVIVLTNKPARIKEIIDIRLPTIRGIEIKETSEFQKIVRKVRQLIE
jgi:NitT/TauT family transport system ATP-binding protein